MPELFTKFSNCLYQLYISRGGVSDGLLIKVGNGTSFFNGKGGDFTCSSASICPKWAQIALDRSWNIVMSNVLNSNKTAKMTTFVLNRQISA